MINRKSLAILIGFTGLFAASAAWAPPGGNGGGNAGGKTGNGQDTPVDVYLYHVAPYGILGDARLPDGDATLYPSNRTLSGTFFSCAGAIQTDQAQGYVRMFVPSGNQDGCADGINRFLRIRSDYDLDQDGLCVIPYTGRSNAGSFSRGYGCVGTEPDLLEEVMVTLHLDAVLGPGGTTAVGLQIRLLDYGDSYVPSPAYDPGFTDIEFAGSQERAFNISLEGVTTSIPDAGDPEVRVFENATGSATICQVVWKNAHSKNCEPVAAAITGLTIKGKVDPTPIP